jgi:hypothetical protein
MTSAGTMPVPGLACPDCDRCARPMAPTGWIPRPDGNGKLCRLTLFRCEPCDRLFDERWGYREATPGR